MFIVAFEKNIECLDYSFNQNGLEYYEALLQVLILDASKKNYDTELKKILGFYNNDFDEDILKTQLQIFSKNFLLKNSCLLLILKISSKRWHQAQGNFCQKLEIFCLMSISITMIFPTHKEEVDKLNLKKLATDFVLNVPNRTNFFAVPE